MKSKILAHSILWASLFVVTKILVGDAEHYRSFVALLAAYSGISVAILGAGDCSRWAARSARGNSEEQKT